MDGIATQCGMNPGGGDDSWSPPGNVTEWHYGNNTEVGGEWSDMSGNNNHATLDGSASVDANGLKDSFATLGSVDISSSFSLVCWVYIDAAATTDIGLFGGLVDNIRYYADYVSDTQWRFGYYWKDESDTLTDHRGSWVHVAFVSLLGTDMNIYVNGVLDGAEDSNPKRDVIYVGKSGTSGPFNIEDSSIDDVIIYRDTAIPATYVTDIYNNSPASRV